LGRLAAFAALLGFLFTATAPGAALVNGAGRAMAVTGVVGVAICHAQGGAHAASQHDGDASAAGGECCLICQAAHMADGALASSWTAPLPIAMPAFAVPAKAGEGAGGVAAGPLQARAPPAA
jgi:hypothetical protein